MFNWLQHFADWLIYSFFDISSESHLGDSLNFFVYDTIKILILLFLITFLMGIVNSYFPVDRIKNFLSRNKLYGGEYVIASTFGAVTPFCSCSSVPLFIGFVKGGIPLGVTFAFLVTSPLVNEVAIAIFLGMFGLKTTLVYVISGLLLGVISGVILNKLNLESLLTNWVHNVWKQAKADQEAFASEKITFVHRIPTIIKEALGIVKSVFAYVLIGIAIGAAMHGYIPEGFLNSTLVRTHGMPSRSQYYWEYPCMPTLQELFRLFRFLLPKEFQ
jgi:uncharacterized membrane protein YraQ (UPF0718 family)